MDALEFKKCLLDLARKIEHGSARIDFGIAEDLTAYETITLYTDAYLFSDDNENIHTKLRTLKQTDIYLSIYFSDSSSDAKLGQGFRDYFRLEIERVERCMDNPSLLKPSTHKTASPYKWNKSVHMFIELCCFIFFSGCFDQLGRANVSFLGFCKDLGKFFNVNVIDPYDVRRKIADRKRRYTPFIDLARDNYHDNIKMVGIRRS